MDEPTTDPTSEPSSPVEATHEGFGAEPAVSGGRGSAGQPPAPQAGVCGSESGGTSHPARSTFIECSCPDCGRELELVELTLSTPELCEMFRAVDLPKTAMPFQNEILDMADTTLPGPRRLEAATKMCAWKYLPYNKKLVSEDHWLAMIDAITAAREPLGFVPRVRAGGKIEEVRPGEFYVPMHITGMPGKPQNKVPLPDEVVAVPPWSWPWLWFLFMYLPWAYRRRLDEVAAGERQEVERYASLEALEDAGESPRDGLAPDPASEVVAAEARFDRQRRVDQLSDADRAHLAEVAASPDRKWARTTYRIRDRLEMVAEDRPLAEAKASIAAVQGWADGESPVYFKRNHFGGVPGVLSPPGPTFKALQGSIPLSESDERWLAEHGRPDWAARKTWAEVNPALTREDSDAITRDIAQMTTVDPEGSNRQQLIARDIADETKLAVLRDVYIAETAEPVPFVPDPDRNPDYWDGSGRRVSRRGYVNSRGRHVACPDHPTNDQFEERFERWLKVKARGQGGVLMGAATAESIQQTLEHGFDGLGVHSPHESHRIHPREYRRTERFRCWP